MAGGAPPADASFHAPAISVRVLRGATISDRLSLLLVVQWVTRAAIFNFLFTQAYGGRTIALGSVAVVTRESPTHGRRSARNRQ